MSFIHDNFLLHSKTARRLYHDHVESLPLYDYHCHLSPKDIAENRRFSNLFEIWLEGDHYKWRAMRTNGVKEAYCTGGADPYEKFLAWAETVPYTVRSPLYHWTHLELKRYFGIDILLNKETAKEIWEEANARLKEEEFCAHGILDKFGVELVGTTDDPVDDLRWHDQIRASELGTRVVPTFRPDKAMDLRDVERFGEWCERLGEVSGCETKEFEGFLAGLEARHEAFHERGGRISDHGVECLEMHECSKAEAGRIFERAREGLSIGAHEQAMFRAWLMEFFGHLDHARGWVKQLHLGARRNNNSRMMAKLGADTGFDSIGDYPQVDGLADYLDRLDAQDKLPKMVLYNLNPADNYLFASMIGNFQDGSVPGKLQFGSGWWFLDQKEGITWQLNALSNLGLLSRFVGMLTDSRSLLSYPRHEYFRRILCEVIGEDVDKGEIPNDQEMLARLVQDISYYNAVHYFGM